MALIRVSEQNREEAVLEAAEAIRAEGIVAFPTETFYGLGVRYDSINALSRLCVLKQRSKDKALPVIVGDMAVLASLSGPPDAITLRLMERFWPGPLTILLEAGKDIPDLLTAGTGKVAVRMPGKSFALDLVRSLGFPVTATSANISGMPPADRADEVIRYFGEGLDLLIDEGPSPGGRPSTIIEVRGSEIVIVRSGTIPDSLIFGAV